MQNLVKRPFAEAAAAEAADSRSQKWWVSYISAFEQCAEAAEAGLHFDLQQPFF